MKELKNVFKLIIFPAQTWGYVLQGGVPSATIERNLFYPLIGVTALSCFCQMFYFDELKLSAAIISAIVNFAAYFLGYIVSVMAIAWMLGKIAEKNSKISEGRIKELVMMNLSVLMILAILQNLLPTSLILLELFKLYLLFIISKSLSYFPVQGENRSYYVLGVFVAVMFSVELVRLVFNLIMPEV